MPEVTVNLSEQENDDLETLSEDRQQSPEDCVHDLLVGAIADAMAERADRPESRARARGVVTARKEAKLTQAWDRTFQRMSRRV
jgi:hypothetical protein